MSNEIQSDVGLRSVTINTSPASQAPNPNKRNGFWVKICSALRCGCITSNAVDSRSLREPADNKQAGPGVPLATDLNQTALVTEEGEPVVESESNGELDQQILHSIDSFQLSSREHLTVDNINKLESLLNAADTSNQTLRDNIKEKLVGEFTSLCSGPTSTLYFVLNKAGAIYAQQDPEESRETHIIDRFIQFLIRTDAVSVSLLVKEFSSEKRSYSEEVKQLANSKLEAYIDLAVNDQLNDKLKKEFSSSKDFCGYLWQDYEGHHPLSEKIGLALTQLEIHPDKFWEHLPDVATGEQQVVELELPDKLELRAKHANPVVMRSVPPPTGSQLSSDSESSTFWS